MPLAERGRVPRARARSCCMVRQLVAHDHKRPDNDATVLMPINT